ncbi:MAG: DUF4382 domain-containing protein [Pseudomonadota bacterium]
MIFEQTAWAPGKKWTMSVLAAAMLALGGCGGSSSTPDVDEPVAGTPPVDNGKLMIGLTDAEGDFAAYTVDVLSVALLRANGSVVETLPNTTRVDFSELTEVTEFLSIATVPTGAYERAQIRLDFSDADIIVQDEMGATDAAIAVDDEGNALGEYTVELQLAQSDRIVIAPGVPASFSLDFDLEASNRIDDSVSPAVVSVSPVLLAMAELESDREHRVRGSLDSVDTDNSLVTLNLRPFQRRSGNFGELTFGVDAQTIYDVDGEGYVGIDGLTALAALPSATPVVAAGMIDDGNVVASTVYAGTSVPWADDTLIKGVVTARTGNVLTVSGRLLSPENQQVGFSRNYSVQIGDATAFSAPGIDSSELDGNSISVGQRIVAFGELVDDITLDAQSDRVVMRYANFSAQVNTVAPLTAELFLLDGRRPAAFDFTGTGMDMTLDADPDNYEIETGTLGLATLAAGDAIRIRGLVNAFGAAPADFNAKTVVDVDLSARAGQLLVVWPLGEPSTMPFISTSPSALNIDIAESREVLSVRGVPRPATSVFDMLSLIANEEGTGLFAVRVRGESGRITMYRNFADLVEALNAALAEGLALQQINATVRADGDLESLPTTRATFVLREPADAS